MELLTTKQVAVRIAIIISSVELAIMLLFRAVPHEAGTYLEAVLDTILLAALSTPAIYMWVIKPFVHARDNALAKFNQLALTDPLTQLANRRLISEHLKKIIAGNVRHKDHGAVLLIDLDEFKHVNDIHGHEAGDAVLVAIADRLRSVVRSEDIIGRIGPDKFDVIGRLGGDEFVILIHRLGANVQIAQDKALLVAAKLVNAIYQPVEFNRNMLIVSASIGIRLLGFENQDADIAISEADIAMYRAKKAGKGCAVLFEK